MWQQTNCFSCLLCPIERFFVANCHCSVCVCVHVCMRAPHMCGFGPSDAELAQGFLCHSLPSQRAFCSTIVLECFLGHPAGSPGRGPSDQSDQWPSSPSTCGTKERLRSGFWVDRCPCLFSDGTRQQPVGCQHIPAQLLLNHIWDGCSFLLCVCLRACVCRLEYLCATVFDYVCVGTSVRPCA